ncbi:hypothetical protein D3C72_1879960 [compost metagenome]
MLRRYRFARVAHGDLHGVFARGRQDDVDHAALVGIPDRIRQQVRDGLLEQPAVDGGGAPADDPDLQVRLQRFRLVVLGDFGGNVGQFALPGDPGLRAPVGLRQEQHVVDDAGQPVQILKVGTQDFAQGVLGRAGL